MSDVQELIKQARRLGESIVANARVRAFIESRETVDQDGAAQKLLSDFTAQAERIRRLEAEQKPVEVADKQKLGELERSLAGNAALQRLMRTQADYLELMNQVTQAMEEPIASATRPAAPA
jgi:cell fate (sporulation/competence/biofilm development) regulator YlbF (YheA/YmcA/DUF963 family)